jgi:RecQ-mediated genome instability protein 1
MNAEVLVRINKIKPVLLSKYTIKVKNDWISECVNFCCEENPEISDDELEKFVFEQFILSDAKDSFNPVIPATIIQKKEPFTLNGTFVLQLQFLIDICKFFV